MKNNLKVKILICIIGTIVSIFLSIVYLTSKQNNPEKKTTETTEINEISEVVETTKIKEAEKRTIADIPLPSNNNYTKEENKITLVFDEHTIDLSFTPNTNFYDALIEAKEQKKITFNGINHPALGFFVTEIGPLKGGGGKDLLYYVNGKQASVGVSDYKLKDGDIIEWKLE